jgi:hypothetical protein
MADTTKNPPLACYYLAAVWPTCGVARVGASSRIPSAGVGPGPRNLPSGNALYAVPTLGCVGHVSDSGDTGVGVQRDLRHHDERTIDVGDHSVDRRLAAAPGLVSSGIRSFDGGERSHEIFRGSPDSPAGRLFPCSAASFGNWMWFLPFQSVRSQVTCWCDPRLQSRLRIHHTGQTLSLLKEAARVGRAVVI